MSNDHLGREVTLFDYETCIFLQRCKKYTNSQSYKLSTVVNCDFVNYDLQS